MACISLSKIGGSRGIGSRQRSEAATITYQTEITPTSSFLLPVEQQLDKKEQYTVVIGYGKIEVHNPGIFLLPRQVKSQLLLHLQQFPLHESLRTEYPAGFAGNHFDLRSGV